MEKTNYIPIVFSTDHNYVMQAGVCIFSLLTYADDACYDIFILVSKDVNEIDKDILRKQVVEFPGHRISFVEHNGEFDKSFEVRSISTMAYYRLMIPWLIPQYDKIIYSDVDVIFHLSLKRLYETDIEDYVVGMVPAVRLRLTKRGRVHCKHVKLDINNYFNSGFLFINAKKQRELKLDEEYLKLSGERFTYQDQDIINTVCRGQIMSLSTKYCILPTLFDQFRRNDPKIHIYYGDNADNIRYIKGEDCIIHYAGPKPWVNYTYGYYFWWEMYRKSIFYDSRFDIDRQWDIIDSNVSWRIIFKNIVKKILHKR